MNPTFTHPCTHQSSVNPQFIYTCTNHPSTLEPTIHPYITIRPPLHPPFINTLTIHSPLHPIFAHQYIQHSPIRTTAYHPLNLSTYPPIHPSNLITQSSGECATHLTARLSSMSVCACRTSRNWSKEISPSSSLSASSNRDSVIVSSALLVGPSTLTEQHAANMVRILATSMLPDSARGDRQFMLTVDTTRL